MVEHAISDTLNAIIIQSASRFTLMLVSEPLAVDQSVPITQHVEEIVPLKPLKSLKSTE